MFSSFTNTLECMLAKQKEKIFIKKVGYNFSCSD